MKNETKELKQEYIEEALKHFSESMRKYFEKETSAVYKTENGNLISFSKPSIEKSFCFGYDECVAESYEGASKAMRDLDKEKFFERNLDSVKRDLRELENSEKIYFLNQYRGGGRIQFFVSEEYKQKFPSEKYINATSADRSNLIEIQKQEIEKFKKRLNTYYKRYGLSKLKTWTYSTND